MPIPSPYGDDVDIPEVPLHELLLFETALDLAETNPDKKAFINGANPDDFVTFKQVVDHSLAATQFLHNRGFSKQIACTVISNCHQFPIFFIAVSTQGGTFSMASALFTEYELLQQLKDCKCTTVLTDLKHLERVQQAAKEQGLVKTVIMVGARRSDLPPSAGGIEYFTWDDVIATVPDLYRPPVDIDLVEDVVLLPYSSGTTGPPKGVMLTHKNFVSMGAILRTWTMENLSLEPHYMVDWTVENMVLLLPFYHIYGFMMVSQSLALGATTVILDGFDPHLFLSCIEKYRPPQISIVPPILLFLTKSPLVAKYDLSSLTKIATGAAPAGKDLVDDAKRKYPNVARLEQGYGMTELCVAAFMPNKQSRSKFGCVGKLLHCCEMKIVDTETGAELPAGKAGEICVKGPIVMKGYLGRPEATRDAIRNGWMHTGDIGYVDGDGDLFIIDRLKELIKVKGLQVPPAELEDLLLSNHRIADAAVIGVPDEAAGELPKAFIVRADKTLKEKEVYDFVAAKLSKYKHLKGGVEFISAIPRSAAGKILRKELRDRNAKAKI